MSEVRTCHEPPPPGPKMLIHRIKGRSDQWFTILSQALFGVYTHWTGKRSEPCFEGKRDCPGHRAGYPLRWKGYLHAWDHQKKRDVFVEITPLVAEEFLLQVPDRQQLRGLRVIFKRSSEDKGARLKCDVRGYFGKADELPPPKDPLETLKALWELGHDVDGHSLNG